MGVMEQIICISFKLISKYVEVVFYWRKMYCLWKVEHPHTYLKWNWFRGLNLFLISFKRNWQLSVVWERECRNAIYWNSQFPVKESGLVHSSPIYSHTTFSDDLRLTFFKTEHHICITQHQQALAFRWLHFCKTMCCKALHISELR